MSEIHFLCVDTFGVNTGHIKQRAPREQQQQKVLISDGDPLGHRIHKPFPMPFNMLVWSKKAVNLYGNNDCKYKLG